MTKPLGIGILTTAAKADLVDEDVLQRVYHQMATLNKVARDIMVKYSVHSCTDVTGFALLGHSFEMAQGSKTTIHIQTNLIPFHPEAYEMAEMGFIPAGAYRNRAFAESGVFAASHISRAMLDICYDPQTSGGLLMSIASEDALQCLAELKAVISEAAIIGHVTQKENTFICLE